MGSIRIALLVGNMLAASPVLAADVAPEGLLNPDKEPRTSASAVPQDLNPLDLMRSVDDASTQIVTAAQSTSAPAPDTARAALLQPFAAALPALKLATTAAQEVDPKKLSAQLKVLSDSVAAFVKQHGGG
jgi:hypothetical protein